MSPWNALGWVLVAFIGLGLTLGAIDMVESRVSRMKRRRQAARQRSANRFRS